jgi:hypothetical protein
VHGHTPFLTRVWRRRGAQANGTGEVYFNPAACSAADVAHAEFLGSFLARALLDGAVRPRAAALRHGVTLGGVRLCDAFYKALLGAPLTLADVADVDAGAAAALRALLRADRAAPLPHVGAFVHAACAAGRVVALLPLKPGGASIAVTHANVSEYVQLKAHAILHASVARTLGAALAAFHALVPPSALRASGLGARQLRRALCGEGGEGFDVTALRRRTRYGAPYSDAHPVIGWLWDVLAREGPACQAAFLLFVTGSACAPAGGFGAPRGGGGDDDGDDGDAPPPLEVVCAPGAPRAPPRLPTAHTCSATLELPPYGSRAQLREKLLRALTDGAGFGFA